VFELGQPEIEDLYAPIFGDENVLRLQITVDDSSVMCRTESLGYR
jgi:hypothetical protein